MFPKPRDFIALRYIYVAMKTEVSVVQNFLGSAFNNLYIQGVTGGMCETSGECSLGQTIPI